MPVDNAMRFHVLIASLSPALRLGRMVLPEGLVDGVLSAKGEREAWASVLEQLALADFNAPRDSRYRGCPGEWTGHR